MASTKQGGDEEEKLKNKIDQKDNEASSSRKDKGKCIFEEDNNDNPMMSESERIAMEKKGKELDELNALRKKFEAEEAEAKNANLMANSIHSQMVGGKSQISLIHLRF
ncbi:unnamed protein product [Lactuca saligna]|uniref:Uncharacterized protein n=1 Tax=Lactuca saligna TaxID=75948 RepID=A0AA35Y716_LACSI|nr:unnamed protein product [Lactuca saligna]